MQRSLKRKMSKGEDSFTNIKRFELRSEPTLETMHSRFKFSPCVTMWTIFSSLIYFILFVLRLFRRYYVDYFFLTHLFHFVCHEAVQALLCGLFFPHSSISFCLS